MLDYVNQLLEAKPANLWFAKCFIESIHQVLIPPNFLAIQYVDLSLVPRLSTFHSKLATFELPLTKLTGRESGRTDHVNDVEGRQSLIASG